MLALHTSNPDNPYTDLSLSKETVGLAESVLMELNVSQLLSCRVWTVLGQLSSHTSDLGAVYANIGNWQAEEEAVRNATKLGEHSVGSVDYGLYAYVHSFSLFSDSREMAFTR